VEQHKQDTTTAAEPVFAIQRLYLKDASFEAPNAPEIFRGEWSPSVDLDLQLQNLELEDGVFEVTVSATATAKIKDKVAFLVEVKHAAIFTIKNFPKDQVPAILAVMCPGIIFPYVRETISDLVVRGSFPQLLLDPVNFEALYVRNLQQQAGAAAEVSEGSSSIN
jgi:preprotein translocase subunit SecB